jgi:polyisoprenyl-phosphate glycosyltransferase
MGVFSILMLGYTLGSRMFGRVVDGWTSLATIVLLIGSSQLLVLGVIGEYVGRFVIEAKRRPLFVIESIVRSPPNEQVSPQVGD